MYEKIALPTILFNIETWTRIKGKEWNEIRSIQAKIISDLLQVPITSPYWGMIKETGWWPFEYVIKFKKLMLYHNIMRSEDNRLTKKVIEQQKIYGYRECWYGEVKEMAEELNIKLEKVDRRETTKSKWKKGAKENIQKNQSNNQQKV